MTSSPKHEHCRDDKARDTRRRTIRRMLCSTMRFGSIIPLGLIAASLSPAAAADALDRTLNPTPLVLKDGRIAEVSVHTIPFPEDAAAPASNVEAELDAFTDRIATDCFLTAQVIGHVDKGEISGRETADIHRLARARADTIQTSLIDNGLPVASIASVWDWRFMVQEPRVTLWIFRLTAGEDCDGTPLDRQIDDRIAAVDSPSIQETGKAATTESSAVVAKPAATTTVQQTIVPAAKPRTQEITAPLPAIPAAPAETGRSKAAEADQTDEADETQVAALSAGSEIDKVGSIGMVDDGALEVVFATNSSFFPHGAGDQLRAFMKTLDKGTPYVLRILTSVDGNDGVSGVSSDDEAARYNAWLAERRFKRVEAWLLKNADGRTLTIEPSLVENDGSRRVRVEPAPLG